MPTDVTDPASIKALFAKTKETFGRLDLLFNNAGVGAPSVPLEDLTYEQWKTSRGHQPDRLIPLYTGSVQDYEGPRPKRRDASSITVPYRRHVPRVNSAPYSSTKHALTGLTKATSLDGRKYDIACGQIDIGNASIDSAQRSDTGSLQPDGSLMVEPRMDTDDIARSVVFMASLPLEANVLFITVMATKMPYVGRA